MKNNISQSRDYSNVEAVMSIERLPVGSLHIDPSNLRKHPDRNLDAIKASLARFKQQRPILIDPDNVVRAGNGTLQAAIALGWTEIDCVRTPLRGTEATAYAISDNRSAELAEWHSDALADTLKALGSEDFDLVAIGFTAEEVERLCGGMGGDVVEDPSGEWQGMPEFQNEGQASIRCIVHFKDEEDKTAFEELVGQKIPDNTHAIWYPRKQWANNKDVSITDEP